MKTLAAIATYNEAENIERLVRAILGLGLGLEVLVIDDNSPDGTGRIADGLSAETGKVRVIHRPGKLGLGTATLDAVKFGLDNGYEVVVTMDADFSHDPKFLPDLVAATARYDLVIGSRYLHGISVVNWPLRRLILSTFANWYVRAITGLGLRDCTAGFRCWRREALEKIPLERIASDGYAFVVETTYEASRRGCRVGEVPIVFVERRVGASKISSGVLAESVIMPWRLILRRWQ